MPCCCFPTPSTDSTRRSFAACFVHRLRLAIVLIFITLTVIIGIAWLALHPRAPTFRVTSLSVTNFTVSDLQPQLSGKYDVVLAIKNPNKIIEVVIDHYNVFVCYDKVQLTEPAGKEMDRIFLEKMGQKSLKAELAVPESLNSVVEKVLKDLGKEWSKGLVNLNVKMSARVRYRAGNWPSNLKLLDIHCDDLDVEFSSAKNTGKLRDIGKDCHVSVP